MLTDMFSGLGLLGGTALLYMLIGIVFSTIAVVTPGLGGLFAIAIVLPFAFQLEPPVGIALIMGVTVVSGTGNTITSVLYGIPGSASGVATTFDGYPMSRRGEGIRAVAAGLTASAIGGVFGAVVLGFALPVLRPLVLLFRSPEFLALILLALVFMAFVGQSDPMKGLISGGIGLMLSFVGLEQSTAAQRWTFGQLYLWDGIALVPVVLGLYAITEMIDLIRQGSAINESGQQEHWWVQMRRGMADTVRHWRATLQSSFAGLWVGMAPGLGDAAAQFVGYAQVAKTSKNPKAFGTGTVEGVIAADAATNSKEGGALIPTLAFGIPGSASMAIVLAAFLAFGIQPGPSMLSENISIVWMIIWILVIGNLIGTVVTLAITPGMAKLTELRTSLIVPPILIASIFGAFSASNAIGDVVVMIAVGFLGWLLKHNGYSRAILLIGFVLGQLLEQNYLLMMRVYGAGALTRPIAVGIYALTALIIVVPLLKWLYRVVRG
ncbi:tripartite tricarboxylate transporter permease [Egicoccus sp. AB-alg2]|uniref:tripartite tricarboxylate transporter permease n=1 Tax=Egicoccus sp. AB-alg2 TaxID=3242693 RepID=UPI00359E3321